MPPVRTNPDERLARELVVHALGREPVAMRRFPTGMMHYVYEATFADRASVVVRIAAEYGHAAMRGAAELSRLLRPRGVPLPAILVENLEPPFPHLILERLPGTDLEYVVAGLSPQRLELIAASIVAAQKITAEAVGPGKRYGFAVSSETAPYESWPDLLAAHLGRSRQRIVAAGLFDVRELDPLDDALAAMRPELAAIPATPFLHDTTTRNVIVTADGNFSGIVDVDDLCFGDPRYVVVLTHVAIITRGYPTTYTEAWMRLAGFADDRLFRLYVAMFLADFMAERGQVFNGNESPEDRDHNARLHKLFVLKRPPVESPETAVRAYITTRRK
jgi:aminoglycoside phosphotransferase